MTDSSVEIKKQCHECNTYYEISILDKHDGVCELCFLQKCDNKNICRNCEKSFTRTTLNKYNGVCGRCYTKLLNNDTLDIKMPYKKQTIPKQLRKDVWLMRVGNYVHAKCFACNKDIDSFTFDCAHIIPEIYNGEMTMNNLHVTCSTCNKSCGKMNLLEYKKLFPNDYYKKTKNKCAYYITTHIQSINFILLIFIALYLIIH